MSALQNGSSNIKQVLLDDDKKVGKSRNLLTRLWRTILYDLKIGPKVFNVMVSRYLNDPNMGIKDSSKDRSNHRGNLMKELGADEISWRVFMRGLLVIETEEFELIIRRKHRDRITGEYVYTEHSVRGMNNIQRDEVAIDISDAKVVEGFSDQHTQPMDASAEAATQHPHQA